MTRGEIKLWTLADLKQPPVVFTDSEKNILRLAFCDGGEAFLSATNNDVTKRPAHIRCMATGICDKVTRNLSEQEWAAWVGTDIEYEPTCPDKGLPYQGKRDKGSQVRQTFHYLSCYTARPVLLTEEMAIFASCSIK